MTCVGLTEPFVRPTWEAVNSLSGAIRMIHKRLAIAICTGLCLTSLIGPQVASAQKAPTTTEVVQAKSTKTLQTVFVTGSLIKQSLSEGAQPVLHIDRQQIVSSGAVNVADLLQRMSVSGAALNGQSDYSTGNGASRIDLRYLGANRTLVLLDGKRLAAGSAGLGLQTQLADAPDLSVIPTSIVDHIEVLLDGASAIYGSDAIAGVVNIITRKNYDGANASVDFGCYLQYGCDGKNRKVNLTLGHVWDRGSLTGSVTYENGGEVNSGNRAISRTLPNTGNLFLSTGFRGTYILNTPQGVQNLVLNNLGGYNNPVSTDLHPVTDADLNDTDLIYPPYLAPQKVSNVYLSGHFNFTDHLRFDSTFLYSRRKSFDVAAYAYAYVIAGSIPGPNEPPLIIPSTQPYNPFGYDLNVSANGGASVGDTFILLRQDPNKLATYLYDSTSMQYIADLSGDFTALGRPFDWQASFNYGNVDEDVNLGGAFSSINLRNALGPTSQCGPGTIHPDCVPYNLFGPNSQAASNYLFYTSANTNSESQAVWNASVSSSQLADLPGGELGFALGFERRTLYGHTVVDPLRVAGVSVFASSQPTQGSYSTNAVYGEFQIPLLQHLPGIYALGLDLQSRHVSSTTFPGNTSSRAMLTYNPTESILLRATWAQGFRVPSLNDLFSGAAESFPPIVDPCLANTFANLPPAAQQRCLAAGVPAGGAIQIGVKPGFIAQGNPNLVPETSVSRTLGIVWSPDFAPGLSVKADYYKIDLKNAITTLSPQDVLNACYLGGNQTFCDAIQRTPSTGIIFRAVNSVQNIARIATSGIDYGVSYRLPTSAIGTFEVALNGTHIRDYTQTTPNFNGSGGVSTQQYVGIEQGGITFPQGMPANKVNINVDWHRGNWSADYSVYYIEGITGACSNVSSNGTTNLTALGLCSEPNQSNPSLSKNRMADVVYNDVSAAYAVPSWHTTFRLGINNLLDRNPPVCYSCSFHFDPTLYRLPGRFVFARIETKL